MNKLNQDEKELLESYETEDWISVASPDEINKYKAAAKHTFRKDKRVNIRMSELDLELLPESMRYPFSSRPTPRAT